ncbi:hypothetical protein J4Q44_G00019360 [Coregonus suidteri]|uniref:EGF-like domain-containing protein n=1 Tax=Coregonus suidteri TaxID=861788 RepID=A0AAN8MGJ1_9TELE
MCTHGTYGLHCERTCLCHDTHTLSCHPLKGEVHVPASWAGLYCKRDLLPWLLRPHGCLEPCLCVNGGVCDSVSGRCHCTPLGLFTVRVPVRVVPIGKNCSLECSCSNSVWNCSPIDGTCFCKEGWQGPLCDQPCPMGTFGPGCLKRCDCLHADGCQGASGQCQCLPGWTGARCAQTCPAGFMGTSL